MAADFITRSDKRGEGSYLPSFEFDGPFVDDLQPSMPDTVREMPGWLRDEDVLIRQGVFWHTTSLVPHSRIQHVDTLRGPLERWLGLARVVIYTAGTRGARLTIPALAAEEAEALRDRLALLGGRGDAV